MKASAMLFRFAMFSKEMNDEQTKKLYQLLAQVSSMPADELSRFNEVVTDDAIEMNK